MTILTPEQRANFNRTMTRDEEREYWNFLRGVEAQMCVEVDEPEEDDEEDDYSDHIKTEMAFLRRDQI